MDKKAKKKKEGQDRRAGNQFWKRRSTHGRKRLFETSDLMWEAACEYFQWCVDNPLQEAIIVKSGPKAGSMFKAPVVRPFTMEGLCNYLDCNTEYFRQFKKSLPDDEDDFSRVIARIENTVFQQQYEGAAGGLLNSNIVARKLGLVDKKETEHKGGQTIEFVPKNQQE
ncbi:MAG: terminase small subunit [Thiotrichales bacterium]